MVNVSIQTHRDLYTKEGIQKALDFAKTLTIPNSYPEFQFHFYWRVPRDFTRKQVLPIKSCIVNHDLNKVKINLWSNVDLSHNDLVKPLMPYINLKIYDQSKEARGTIIERKTGLQDDPLCWLGGDMFRLLVLYKYGGVYCDMDVAILRDLSPLAGQEFLYQWGSSGTQDYENRLCANGAIMRLNANSTVAADFLQQLYVTPPNPNSTCWGTDLYSHVMKKHPELSIFPCAWFNTEWGPGIPLAPFQRNINGNNSDELYDGAFTWHWHNKWDDVIETGCKFENIEKIVNTKFEAMR